MTDISRPIVNASLSGALLPVANADQKVLVLGQLTSAGTAVSGELQEAVSKGTEFSLFGAPSQIANALDGYFLVNNVNLPDCIGLSDPAGVAATGAIVFTAVSATENGSLDVIIGDERNGTFSLPIVITDDDDTIAAKLVALIQANTKCLMSAVASTNSCNLTAENVGLIGNNYPIKVSGSVGGVTYAITGMSGGTLAPTLTNVLDVVGSTRYQTVIWPAEWGVDTIKDWLDARFNVVNDIQDGVAVMVAVDTKANIVTLGDTHNSNSVIIYGEKAESTSYYKGPSEVEQPLAEAAIVGAIRALRRSEGSDVSDYVVGSGFRDKIGGPHNSSLPYMNTPLPLPVQGTGKGWTTGEGAEVSQLDDAGISVLGSNTAKTATILADVVTTYKTDTLGNPDLSWKYLNYVDTASSCREFMFNNIKRDTAQARLTEGALSDGHQMENADSIRALFKGYYGTLSGLGWVLLQDGETALEFFDKNLTITLNMSTGTVLVAGKLPIVTQLRRIDMPFSLAFTVGS